MSNIIEIRDMTLNHGNRMIFNKLTIDIEENSFVSIIGSNNSGKSSLAYAICGILPYLGSIKLFGYVVNKKNMDIINPYLSFVLEETFNIFMTDLVIDEIYCSAINKKDVDVIVKKLEIEHLINREPKSLSYGEMQLVALACALVKRPRLLVLDNALNMLDAVNKKRVMKLLNQFNKKGLTIINITSNSEDVLYGNRVVIFKEGKIVLNDTLREALEQEKTFTTSNVNLPFMADLCIKLKYYNIISKIELDRVRLVNTIWK